MDGCASLPSVAGLDPNLVHKGPAVVGSQRVTRVLHGLRRIVTRIFGCGIRGAYDDDVPPSRLHYLGRSTATEEYDSQATLIDTWGSDEDIIRLPTHKGIRVKQTIDVTTAVPLNVDKLRDVPLDGEWTLCLVECELDDSYSTTITHLPLPSTRQTPTNQFGSCWSEIILLPWFRPIARTISCATFEVAVRTPCLPWLDDNNFAYEIIKKDIPDLILPRHRDVELYGYPKALMMAETRFMKNAYEAGKGDQGLEEIFERYKSLESLLVPMNWLSVRRNIEKSSPAVFEKFRTYSHAIQCWDVNQDSEDGVPDYLDRQKLLDHIHALGNEWKSQLYADNEEELYFLSSSDTESQERLEQTQVEKLLEEKHKLTLIGCLFQSAGGNINPNRSDFSHRYSPSQNRQIICNFLEPCLTEKRSLDMSEHVLLSDMLKPQIRRYVPVENDVPHLPIKLVDNTKYETMDKFLEDMSFIYRQVPWLDCRGTLLPLFVCWLDVHDSDSFRTLASSCNEVLLEIVPLLLKAEKAGEQILYLAALYCYQKLVVEVPDSQHVLDTKQLMILILESIFADKKFGYQRSSFCVAMVRLIKATDMLERISCGKISLRQTLTDYGTSCYSQYRIPGDTRATTESATATTPATRSMRIHRAARERRS